MLINLDSPRSNAAEFFDGLRRLFHEHPALKARMRLVVMKDFDRPGLDPRLIQRMVQPFARRIFHPEEAALALIEGFFYFSDEDRRSAAAKPVPLTPAAPPRALDDLLFGPGAEPLAAAPPWNATIERAIERERKAMLFRWLTPLLHGERRRSAALLPPVSEGKR